MGVEEVAAVQPHQLDGVIGGDRSARKHSLNCFVLSKRRKQNIHPEHLDLREYSGKSDILHCAECCRVQTMGC